MELIREGVWRMIGEGCEGWLERGVKDDWRGVWWRILEWVDRLWFGWEVFGVGMKFEDFE